MHSSHSSSGGLGRFLRSPAGLALLAFLAVAGFYLVTEHTAHLWGYLPYALLLLCPLLHLFMHGAHGGAPDQQNNDGQHRH
jgi:hypothetical protein